MRKVRILLILGVWVAILPFLGFPYSWKDVLFSFSGLVLIYLGYLLYKDYQKAEQGKTFDNFRENSGFEEMVVETTEEITEPTEPTQ